MAAGKYHSSGADLSYDDLSHVLQHKPDTYEGMEKTVESFAIEASLHLFESFMKQDDTDWQAQRDVLRSNRYTLENHVACDVTFIVGKQKQEVTVHKYVLISRSSVFYAMLCGPLQETGQINIPDIEPEVFEQLLRFLYFEAFEPDGDSILALLYAAKKYAVRSLVDRCVIWLKGEVSLDNVCGILQQAHAFDEQDLLTKCLEFTVDNGSSILKHSSFRNLSTECVDIVLRQDDLFAEEDEVYETLRDWAEHECARRNIQPSAENMRRVMGGLKNLIRFSVMDGKYFADKVATENILTAEENITLLRYFLGSGNLDDTKYTLTARKPRFLEKQRVIRFTTLGSPRLEGSGLHAIDFRCSKEVLLLGIVIYGATQNINTYYGHWNQVNYSFVVFVSDTEVQLLDESKRAIISMKRQLTITEEELLEVLFDEPILLKKNWYTITLVISNSGTTRSGANGEQVVSLGDGQSIEFRDSLLSASGTTVLNGQIPGLLLCRKR